MPLDLAKFKVQAPIGMPSAGTEAQASLSIESTPPGADIEVDGDFVGNTPSTLSLPLGSHEVKVQKRGFVDWSRKMTVTGGAVHVNAELEHTSEGGQ